jgi:hypothetical protein
MSESITIGHSSAVLEVLPTDLCLQSSTQSLLQHRTSTAARKQHKSGQGSAVSQLSDEIASSLDAALKVVVQASCATKICGAPASAVKADARALVKRAVGGGSRSLDSFSASPLPGKKPSLQQRQWYLFQRAAWSEAQRQIAESAKTSDLGACEVGSKGDGTGRVQRLISSWWKEYKFEVLSEAAQSNHTGVVSEGKDKMANAFRTSGKSSIVPGTECQFFRENEGRQDVTEHHRSSSSARAQACKQDSDIDSSSNSRSGTATSAGRGVVSSRSSSTGEAELYARTAQHVWKRFGARIWEAEVTNEEARALYRAWS